MDDGLPFVLERSAPCNPLRWVSEEKAHSVFVLDAYLERNGQWDGPLYHRWMGEWLSNGFVSEKELQGWLRERLRGEGAKPGSGKGRNPAAHAAHFDHACRQAEQRHRQGVRVGTWREDSPHSQWIGPCPRLFFGKGPRMEHPHRVAVFNSRKSRRPLPQEPWLSFLRSSLARLSSQGMGFVSSWGTLTYDLVTTYAQTSGAALLLVLPFSLEEAGQTETLPPSLPLFPALSLVTCRTRAVSCPKATRMVCRDRLLAFLSDAHLILEIRSGGNLESILETQQALAPRSQWIFIPNRITPQNRVNVQLQERFPQWSKPVSQEDPGTAPTLNRPALHAPVHVLKAESIEWKAYLYHYTRSCTGPWPDQSYEDYMMSLLRNDPFSGHTALDTLIRILSQGRIRAGRKLIRGGLPVISWTSRPPQELSTLRRWNPALIRWTFEPYGIAVHRSRLLRQGCKPVVYAPDGAYTGLKASDRFRFQRHEAPACKWKYEREWRLPKDLDLGEMGPEEAFLFVNRQEDVDHLGGRVNCDLPVVVTVSQEP